MNFLKIFLVLFLFGTIAFASSTILILDASGSMSTYLNGSSSMTRIDAAKQAANTFLNNVQSGDEVALIVYYDCDDIKTEVDFTTNFQLIRNKIANVKPDSYTPIARALTYAANYSVKSGRPNAAIILLSDGEETCDTQAKAVSAARNAVAGPIRVINVVGFTINDNSLEYANLQEIATAGKGKYYSAQDANQLASSLTQAYQSGKGSSCCVPTFILGAVVCATFLFNRKA
jgi:Ca-activated chloride channel family protein